MPKSIDPESLKTKLAPVVQNLLSSGGSDTLAERLIDFGLECYHAGRRTERKYWGTRLSELSSDCDTPVFAEAEKLEAD
jgi:hypothetical protein